MRMARDGEGWRGELYTRVSNHNHIILSLTSFLDCLLCFTIINTLCFSVGIGGAGGFGRRLLLLLNELVLWSQLITLLQDMMVHRIALQVAGMALAWCPLGTSFCLTGPGYGVG